MQFFLLFFQEGNFRHLQSLKLKEAVRSLPNGKTLEIFSEEQAKMQSDICLGNMGGTNTQQGLPPSPLLSLFPLSDFHIAFHVRQPPSTSGYKSREKGACVGEGWEGKESQFDFPSRDRDVTQRFHVHSSSMFPFPLPPLCLEGSCTPTSKPTWDDGARELVPALSPPSV